ncbi:hypothetical protein B0T22DRAFT_157952 [Podospora appendiculata]|uniref:Uncharacterized protein n=1 Tax=Podospora appendiculata TaxID=314037 RepID=A0AAE0X9J1_9PEZI|nr:hypothetical protein B0T22DRAFT_157952 [Podospora appendiculata]
MSTPSRGWIPVLGRPTANQNSTVALEERAPTMLLIVPVMSVKNWLQQIPPIRKAVSMLDPRRRASSTFPHSPSGTSTPDSEAETAVMEISDADRAAIVEGFTQPHPQASGKHFAPRSPPDASGLPSSQETTSGIDWNYGRVGLTLLQESANESKSSQCGCYDHRRHHPEPRPDFERSTYVNGLSWLLQGLPPDMDIDEVTSLQRALPLTLAGTKSGSGLDDGDPRWQQPSGSPNMVHSILLSLLIYMNEWRRWATPQIIYYSGEFIRYEQEHHVGRSVFTWAMYAVTTGAAKLGQLGDGATGQMMQEMLRYTVEGVTGALQEFAKTELGNG